VHGVVPLLMVWFLVLWRHGKWWYLDATVVAIAATDFGVPVFVGCWGRARWRLLLVGCRWQKHGAWQGMACMVLDGESGGKET